MRYLPQTFGDEARRTLLPSRSVVKTETEST